MPSIDRPPPNSSPPEAEGGMTISKATSEFDFIAGGANGADGALRFGRGLGPTSARAQGGDMTRLIVQRGTKEQDNSPDMLGAALDHLAAGRSVIPICSPLPDGVGCHQHGKGCKGPGKTPLMPWKRYQTELATEAEVRLWFEAWPSMNIGMATGAVSGTVVLDGDSDAAIKFALSQGEGELAEAPMVTTGKGAHWYLEHPGEVVKNFAHKWPMLDFRGDGGYVLLPPSLHRSGNRYQWHATPEQMGGLLSVPPWLMEALRGKKPASSDGNAEEREGIDFGSFVDGVGEGQRNDMLFRLACKLRGEGLDLDLAKLAVLGAAERCTPPYDHEEALAIVERVWETYEANPPGAYFVDDDDDTEVADEEGAEKPEDPDAYPIEHVAEVIRKLDGTEERWLVEGIIGRGQCHWFYAKSGTGKSLVGIKLGLHIAAGLPCGERDVEQGPVLFISEDSALVDFVGYIRRIAAGMGLNLDALPVYINSNEGLRITDKKGRQKVEKGIDQHQPVYVLFDSCERLVPAKEWSSSEHDELVMLIQKCRSERRSIVVIDHTNKAGGDPSLDALYGGRTKSATADHCLHFKGDLNKDGVRTAWTKNRGQPRVPFEVKLVADEETMVLDLVPVHSLKKLTKTERTVLNFLERAPGEWRSIREVVDRTCVGERSAKRALVDLRRKGFLKREMVSNGGKGGHVAKYRTLPDDEVVLGTAGDDQAA